MADGCKGCGAPLESQFVCGFCGTATGKLAQTEDDEIAMLRELGRAAQAVAERARREQTTNMVSNLLTSQKTKNEAVEEAVAQFWSNAPLPQTPTGLRQACAEALSAFAGNRDDNFTVTKSQKAIWNRAESIMTLLDAMGDKAGDITGLRSLYARKRRSLNLFQYIIGICLAIMAVASVIVLPKIFRTEASESSSRSERTSAGNAGPVSASSSDSASRNGGSMQISVQARKGDGSAWDALNGGPDIAACVTASGHTYCLPGGSTRVRGGSQTSCQDTLACSLDFPPGSVEITVGQTVTVEVIDVDAARNDVIGSGTCIVGQECTVGAATVTVQPRAQRVPQAGGANSEIAPDSGSEQPVDAGGSSSNGSVVAEPPPPRLADFISDIGGGWRTASVRTTRTMEGDPSFLRRMCDRCSSLQFIVRPDDESGTTGSVSQVAAANLCDVFGNMQTGTQYRYSMTDYIGDQFSFRIEGMSNPRRIEIRRGRLRVLASDDLGLSSACELVLRKIDE